MVVWPRSLFALHVHERLSYQASDIEHRGVQRSLALQHHMHNLIRPPLAPASPSICVAFFLFFVSALTGWLLSF